MSVYVSSTADLVMTCARTLVTFSGPGIDGISGGKIASVFRAILIAQRAAYASSYHDDSTTIPEVEFPDTASPDLLVNRPDLKTLYEDLRLLRYNTVDNAGRDWLPAEPAAQFDELITLTAAKAAGF
ncbi:hypothetical protein [Actinophytocola sp.]|uniref:hypothetical protein n=1 Tax=Actinophytocola sp. TaxID=1872138 RepID=UPI003D6C3383